MSDWSCGTDPSTGKGQIVNLDWDLDRERPTLGGLLTLLVEGDMKHARAGETTFELFVHGRSADHEDTRGLVSAVTVNFFHHVSVNYSVAPVGTWPIFDIKEGAPSYFSLDRVNRIFAREHVKPLLRWNRETDLACHALRAQLAPVVLAVHLKHIEPLKPEESNADGSVWLRALTSFLSKGDRAVILIGDDPLPNGLELGPNLIRGSDLGLDIGGQLALVNKCSGFIGMASGVASSAIFSTTPYVVFKHPDHDYYEMQRELGDADRLPFAYANQRILRQIPDFAALTLAIDAVVRTP